MLSHTILILPSTNLLCLFEVGVGVTFRLRKLQTRISGIESNAGSGSLCSSPPNPPTGKDCETPDPLPRVVFENLQLVRNVRSMVWQVCGRPSSPR